MFMTDIETQPGILVVHLDQDPQNPREEFNNVATIACHPVAYNRHGLGDICVEPEDWAFPNDVVYRVGLWVYSHSGITIRTGDENPFSCPWDSAWIGHVYVTKSALADAGFDVFDETLAQELVAHELNVYRAYLEGDCYGYTFTTPDGSEDSCFGFYGAADMLNHLVHAFPEYEFDEDDLWLEPDTKIEVASKG